jgi:putative endonuclease
METGVRLRLAMTVDELPSSLCLSQGSIPETSAIMRRGYVYILASKKGGTLYTGVTSDLAQRVWEHENGIGSKFTAKYGVKRLVWFEEHDLVTTAIAREKTIKKWPRQWKINAIEAINPDWNDLRVWLH